ncbi:hypothetical protein BJ508DRAFT_304326 [Ascobolus immersus RN42]|uniref:Uncharacterized protein n=1 Tax=Ascobolus immersus RN42 TaxID=1160509 RepID=A0A3N4ICG5_ASCIM|nr:hypothetical protein BJ508DRAFT_304326 [Ascobolus immersus RN42]
MSTSKDISQLLELRRDWIGYLRILQSRTVSALRQDLTQQRNLIDGLCCLAAGLGSEYNATKRKTSPYTGSTFEDDLLKWGSRKHGSSVLHDLQEIYRAFFKMCNGVLSNLVFRLDQALSNLVFSLDPNELDADISYFRRWGDLVDRISGSIGAEIQATVRVELSRMIGGDNWSEKWWEDQCNMMEDFDPYDPGHNYNECPKLRVIHSILYTAVHIENYKLQGQPAEFAKGIDRALSVLVSATAALEKWQDNNQPELDKLKEMLELSSSRRKAGSKELECTGYDIGQVEHEDLIDLSSENGDANESDEGVLPSSGNAFEATYLIMGHRIYGDARWGNQVEAEDTRNAGNSGGGCS